MTTDSDLDDALRRILFKKPPKAPKSEDRFRNLLALFLILAFVGTLPLLIWKTIPDSNKETIVYILGQISGMALTVVGFYFVKNSGENALDTKRTENTAKAFDAIKAAAESAPAPQEVATGKPEDSVHTVTEGELP